MRVRRSLAAAPPLLARRCHFRVLTPSARIRARSPAGLLTKHVNVSDGRWHEVSSGVGANSDSYYEYLLKT